MAARISARKMREWMVYSELEPFGAPADFWQSGLIASTIMNVNRTKKSQKALTLEDCMPREMTERAEQHEPHDDVGAKALQAFHEVANMNGHHGQ